MEIKNEKQMVVTDNEGKEHLMQILFTYDNEERNTSYVSESWTMLQMRI